MSLCCEQERETNHNKYNIKLNQSEYSSGSNLSRVLVWTRVYQALTVMQYKRAAIQLPHAAQTLENAHI